MTTTTTDVVGCARCFPDGSGDPLTGLEADRLAELEKTIERGLETFLEVGQALMEIRNRKLYRETHGTFNNYVRERFGFTDRRARQLMQAAKVGTTVPVTNEAQARELDRAPEELMQDVWTKAVELAKKEGKDGVTVALIKEARRIARWNFDRERHKEARREAAFKMQLSPRGSLPRGSSRPAAPVNIPASIEACDRARTASDEIRLVLGPWTADGRLPEHCRIPESSTVTAWREKLNGNGSTPRDLRKIVADPKKLQASLPADSPDRAALAKALEVLSEVA